MRALSLSKIFAACALLILSFAFAPANPSKTNEAAKLLPEKIGEFRAVGAAQSITEQSNTEKNNEPALADVEIVVKRSYLSTQGKIFEVVLAKMRTDREAYALFSRDRTKAGLEKQDGIGTAAGLGEFGHLLFYKGAFVGRIYKVDKMDSPDALKSFAVQLADTLDKGEGEIPVLVKHLPDWETVEHSTVYALSLPALQATAGNRPALEAVNFTGGTDAVTAAYGPSRLVIIEHTTPQLATDNDARINARINELKNNNQPVPSVYRRVGNYAVFVFDAPDEATAAQLVDKIAYEQIVQWLGNNPRLLERAQREYSETTAGVILSVIKASGLSLLICLGIGGIFGSIIFKRRRARAAINEAYSDAGGMLRLNLDDMTTRQVDPARLLGKGDVR